MDKQKKELFGNKIMHGNAIYLFRKTLTTIMGHRAAKVKPQKWRKGNKMKRFISILLVLAMVLGMSTSVFAANSALIESQPVNEKAANGESSIEPYSSRWYREDVVEKEKEPFTFYSSDKKKMVTGTYKKVATYYVYRDGSGKRQHKFDTYTYTWTGYYRTSTTGTSSNWIIDSNYVKM